MWGIIVGWATSFGITPHAALYDYSYANLILMGAAMPQFDDEKAQQWDASKDMNNPANSIDNSIDRVTDISQLF